MKIDKDLHAAKANKNANVNTNIIYNKHTIELSDSIYQYTSTNYVGINRALRGDALWMTDKRKAIILKIDKVLSNCLKFDGPVSRIILLNDQTRLFYKSLKLNDIILNKAYTSTTSYISDQDVSSKFARFVKSGLGIMMFIKNKSGVGISGASRFLGLKLVLMPRNVKLRFIGELDDNTEFTYLTFSDDTTHKVKIKRMYFELI